LVLALVLGLAPVLGQAELEAQGKKSDSVVKIGASVTKPDKEGKQTVTLTLDIDNGWHTYANPVGNKEMTQDQTTVTLNTKGKVDVKYPEGTVVKDKIFGEYKVYEGKVKITATVQRPNDETGPLEVTVKFTSCTDKMCLLPATVKIKPEEK
jgi:DsbC/DsbD-like thiol-disulfide interchange protein